MNTSTKRFEGLPEFRLPILTLIVVGAFALLTLPWVNVGGASLSMSAFDFAEWLTIVPTVRFGEDAMQTPLYLRLLPALLVFALTLLPHQRFSWRWWFTAAGASLVIIGLLPPPEYFLDPALRPDTNYEQLVMVAVSAAVLSIVGLSGFLWRFRRGVLPVIFGMAGVLAWFAILNSENYIRAYLPASVNALPFIVWVTMGAVAALFWPESKQDA